MVEERCDESEDQQSRDLNERQRACRQALEKEVGYVKVCRLGQILREKILGRQRILDDLSRSCRRCRRQGRDEKHLNDLKAKVGALGKELHARQRWDTGSSRAD